MHHLPRLRFTLLVSLSLGLATASPVAANWLSDLFQSAAYEELETPEEAAEPIAMPVLEGSALDQLHSDSVLLNSPVSVENGRTEPYAALMPGDLVPGDLVPGDLVPGDLVPGDLVPGDLVPDFAGAMDEEGYFASSPIWGGASAADSCCDRPSILYWNHALLASTGCGSECDRTTDLVLSVPRGCCTVEVPVCVPACCSDTPAYEVDRDWLGRVTHHFCWPCGQEVRIVQLHIGSWVVHTYNR